MVSLKNVTQKTMSVQSLLGQLSEERCVVHMTWLESLKRTKLSLMKEESRKIREIKHLSRAKVNGTASSPPELFLHLKSRSVCCKDEFMSLHVLQSAPSRRESPKSSQPPSFIGTFLLQECCEKILRRKMGKFVDLLS